MRRDQKGVRRFALLDGGLRGTARFVAQPTENLQAAWPPLTPAPGFSPEGGTSLPLVRKPPDTG
jgi:hypothetical protein